MTLYATPFHYRHIEGYLLIHAMTLLKNLILPKYVYKII